MNKNFKVNYLARDFASIKEELKKYATRYYSDTLADLSETGLNSFMIEAVAYAGDVLSYYLDYQTNEAFLSTAVENKNIINLSKSLGYNIKNNTSASGIISIYMFVPDKNGAPNYEKMPIIKKGTQVLSISGASYVTTEDVIITEETVGSNWVVAQVNNFGKPLFYAVKTFVPVVSGRFVTENYPINDFIKFRKLILNDTSAIEIISVVDSEGNYYYEVPSLSQNIVYVSSLNSYDNSQKHSLRPLIAQRRFVFDYDETGTYLLFGAKQYKPDEDLGINPTVEPIKFSLQKYNNDYLQDGFFEPSSLLNGDSYGIGPENTVLTITYRINDIGTSNATIGQINSIGNLITSYTAEDLADPEKRTVLNSIQVSNEEPIVGDTVTLSAEEVRDLGKKIFSAQGRAVTASDYESLSYAMPQKFGALKRVKAERDSSSLKNNINLYVICEERRGSLIVANTRIKENLKSWLAQYKIITDTVDILDAKIVNFGIHFVILVDPLADKTQILQKATQRLQIYYSKQPQIGESFNILNIYRELRKIKEILDIRDVSVYTKSGGDYSSIKFSIPQNLTSDGAIIKIPKNVIYEIKNLSLDITGDVI